jgi:hypothetical protein
VAPAWLPLIDVAAYGDEVEVLSIQQRAKCSKCGSRHVAVLPNGENSRWQQHSGTMTKSGMMAVSLITWRHI